MRMIWSKLRIEFVVVARLSLSTAPELRLTSLEALVVE